MHLADHIRPLLRDHDCVIIPDFGGLVADVSPARAMPGRQALSPPTKLVAFNQALTRNDGLLVDALSQHLGLSIAEARERLRAAVAGLHRELDESNRTELPGIGIFRRAAGRGLAFEYTGTDNLLPASFGLPVLAARPVRATESRTRQSLPVLRTAAGRRSRLGRFVPASIIAAVAGLLLLANYQLALKSRYLPTALQNHLPKWEWRTPSAKPGAATEPQQAALGQDFGRPLPDAADGPVASTGLSLPELDAPAQGDFTDTLRRRVPIVRSESSVAPTPHAAATANASDTPEALATTAHPEADEVPAAVVVSPPVLAPARGPHRVAAAEARTIKTRTGRFYVVAGAYSSLARADEGRRNLLRSGRPARIILPHWGSRLFRLTAGEFADEPAARREAQRLRQTTHCDYITLKY